MTSYNSLTDPHLTGFFSNGRVRRHLRRVGLINRHGEVVSESTYRLNLTRRRKNLMTQSLEEPSLKKKTEEFHKFEFICQGDGLKAGDRFPRIGRVAPSSTQNGYQRSSSSPRSPRYDDGRSTSAPAHISLRHSATSQDNGGNDNGNVNDEKDNQKQQRIKSPRQPSDQQRYCDTIAQEARIFWDSSTLTANHSLDHKSTISPYLMPLPLPPEVPPPKISPRAPLHGNPRRHLYYGNDSSRQLNRLSANHQELDNNGATSPVRSHAHQNTVGPHPIVTMQYFGSHLDLNQRWLDPRDDVIIEQQHCGGNTVIVYRDHISPGTVFSFTSRRHHGYPFSVTVYVNGRQDTRLSTCCESKHSVGTRLGGRFGRFSLVSVENGGPCESCEQKVDNKDKPKPDVTFELFNKAKLHARPAHKNVTNGNEEEHNSSRTADNGLNGNRTADKLNSSKERKLPTKITSIGQSADKADPVMSPKKKDSGKHNGHSHHKSSLRHSGQTQPVSGVTPNGSFFNNLFVERSDAKFADSDLDFMELYEQTEEEIIETETQIEDDGEKKPESKGDKEDSTMSDSVVSETTRESPESKDSLDNVAVAVAVTVGELVGDASDDSSVLATNSGTDESAAFDEYADDFDQKDENTDTVPRDGSMTSDTNEQGEHLVTEADNSKIDDDVEQPALTTAANDDEAPRELTATDADEVGNEIAVGAIEEADNGPEELHGSDTVIDRSEELPLSDTAIIRKEELSLSDIATGGKDELPLSDTATDGAQEVLQSQTETVPDIPGKDTYQETQNAMDIVRECQPASNDEFKSALASDTQHVSGNDAVSEESQLSGERLDEIAVDGKTCEVNNGDADAAGVVNEGQAVLTSVASSRDEPPDESDAEENVIESQTYSNTEQDERVDDHTTKESAAKTCNIEQAEQIRDVETETPAVKMNDTAQKEQVVDVSTRDTARETNETEQDEQISGAQTEESEVKAIDIEQAEQISDITAQEPAEKTSEAEQISDCQTEEKAAKPDDAVQEQPVCDVVAQEPADETSETEQAKIISVVKTDETTVKMSNTAQEEQVIDVSAQELADEKNETEQAEQISGVQTDETTVKMSNTAQEEQVVDVSAQELADETNETEQAEQISGVQTEETTVKTSDTAQEEQVVDVSARDTARETNETEQAEQISGVQTEETTVKMSDTAQEEQVSDATKDSVDCNLGGTDQDIGDETEAGNVPDERVSSINMRENDVEQDYVDDPVDRRSTNDTVNGESNSSLTSGHPTQDAVNGETTSSLTSGHPTQDSVNEEFKSSLKNGHPTQDAVDEAFEEQVISIETGIEAPEESRTDNQSVEPEVTVAEDKVQLQLEGQPTSDAVKGKLVDIKQDPASESIPKLIDDELDTVTTDVQLITTDDASGNGEKSELMKPSESKEVADCDVCETELTETDNMVTEKSDNTSEKQTASGEIDSREIVEGTGECDHNAADGILDGISSVDDQNCQKPMVAEDIVACNETYESAPSDNETVGADTPSGDAKLDDPPANLRHGVQQDPADDVNHVVTFPSAADDQTAADLEKDHLEASAEASEDVEESVAATTNGDAEEKIVAETGDLLSNNEARNGMKYADGVDVDEKDEEQALSHATSELRDTDGVPVVQDDDVNKDPEILPIAAADTHELENEALPGASSIDRSKETIAEDADADAEIKQCEMEESEVDSIDKETPLTDDRRVDSRTEKDLDDKKDANHYVSEQEVQPASSAEETMDRSNEMDDTTAEILQENGEHHEENSLQKAETDSIMNADMAQNTIDHGGIIDGVSAGLEDHSSSGDANETHEMKDGTIAVDVVEPDNMNTEDEHVTRDKTASHADEELRVAPSSEYVTAELEQEQVESPDGQVERPEMNANEVDESYTGTKLVEKDVQHNDSDASHQESIDEYVRESDGDADHKVSMDDDVRHKDSDADHKESIDKDVRESDNDTDHKVSMDDDVRHSGNDTDHKVSMDDDVRQGDSDTDHKVSMDGDVRHKDSDADHKESIDEDVRPRAGDADHKESIDEDVRESDDGADHKVSMDDDVRHNDSDADHKESIDKDVRESDNDTDHKVSMDDDVRHSGNDTDHKVSMDGDVRQGDSDTDHKVSMDGDVRHKDSDADHKESIDEDVRPRAGDADHKESIDEDVRESDDGADHKVSMDDDVRHNDSDADHKESIDKDVRESDNDTDHKVSMDDDVRQGDSVVTKTIIDMKDDETLVADAKHDTEKGEPLVGERHQTMEKEVAVAVKNAETEQRETPVAGDNQGITDDSEAKTGQSESSDGGGAEDEILTDSDKRSETKDTNMSNEAPLTSDVAETDSEPVNPSTVNVNDSITDSEELTFVKSGTVVPDRKSDVNGVDAPSSPRGSPRGDAIVSDEIESQKQSEEVNEELDKRSDFVKTEPETGDNLGDETVSQDTAAEEVAMEARDDTTKEPEDVSRDDTTKQVGAVFQDDTTKETGEVFRVDSSKEAETVSQDTAAEEVAMEARDDNTKEPEDVSQDDTTKQVVAVFQDDTTKEAGEVFRVDSSKEAETVSQDTAAEEVAMEACDDNTKEPEDVSQDDTTKQVVAVFQDDTTKEAGEVFRVDSSKEAETVSQDTAAEEVAMEARDDTTKEPEDVSRDDTTKQVGAVFQDDTTKEAGEVFRVDSSKEAETVSQDTAAEEVAMEACDDNTKEPEDVSQDDTTKQVVAVFQDDTTKEAGEVFRVDSSKEAETVSQDTAAEEVAMEARDDTTKEPEDVSRDDTTKQVGAVFQDDTTKEAGEVSRDDSSKEVETVSPEDAVEVVAKGFQDDTAKENKSIPHDDANEEAEALSKDDATIEVDDRATVDASKTTEELQEMDEMKERTDGRTDGGTDGSTDGELVNKTVMAENVEDTPPIDIKPLITDEKDVELSGIELSASQIHETAQLLAAKADVTSLMLRNTCLNDDGLKLIAESLSGKGTLRYVNLNCNNITADGVSHVVSLLKRNPSIDSLAIHENPIGDQGVGVLVNGLLEMYRDLNPQLPVNPATQTSADETVPEVPSATSGVVDGHNSDAILNADDSRVALVKAKQRSELLSLRMLDIGACGLTSVGAISLAKLIASNVGLTSLSLTGNKGMGTEGWQSLGESLSANTQLDTLELHHNGLGNNALSILLDGLSRNESIATIDLEGNYINDEGGQSVIEWLKTADNICNVHIRSGNGISESIVGEIETLCQSHC